MGIFGWSYPPGCSGPPDDNEPDLCPMCGQPDSLCECEACPVCGEVGNPECYDPTSENYHQMVETEEQRESRAQAEVDAAWDEPPDIDKEIWED